ncbi:MAG: hypothetical protein PF450_04385, partial [Bacteroidales bacterium]|nr:hypothetical protein [Bacteroidales bacterium]
FMGGVLMGTGAPCSGRFDAITKSPLTGIMASSSCGGPFGMALKTSGWDGIIVKGVAKTPTYLVVDSKGVTFKNAKPLWGKDTQTSQKVIIKEGTGSVVIGPAGENLVKFANICSGERYLGRGGLGAVMGSKMLKGIVAKGKEFKIIPKHKEKFDKYRKKAIKYINSNELTSHSYRKFGTNANVNLSNAGGILPVRNFTKGVHGEAHKISGETIAEIHDTTFHTCKPCTILCGHKGTFGGKVLPVPEYETVGLFGSNLEIFDTEAISEWNEICGEMGMDTISAAGTISWTMEATEKGLFDSQLKFGSTEGISETLKNIAKRKGMGDDLAEGTKRLAQKYGGKDFAMNVKGMELPAYDPRGSYGQGLSYAVANRGACHLTTSMFVLEVFLGMMQPHTKRGKHVYVDFGENISTAVNSLHTCLFTAFAYELEPPLIKYTPTFLLNLMVTNMTAIAIKFMDISLWPELWSTITGQKINTSKFLKAGARINVLERYMNTREGISKKDDTLPPRFLQEGRSFDSKERTVPLESMLKKYYKRKGYDKNGIPKDRTLKKYGIEKK